MDMAKAHGLSQPHDEMKEYLALRTLPKEADIMSWWKAQEANSPVLAAMARDFFAVPATSASSERAFSLARHVVTEFRSSLAPETVRAILCLKSWLKLPAIDDDEGSDDDEFDDEVDNESVDA